MFIVIIIGVNIIGVVSDEFASLQTNSTQLAPATDTLLNLFPFFFALGIMAVGISLAIRGLRGAGLV